MKEGYAACGIYTFAGIPVEVSLRGAYFKERCALYLTPDSTPKFSIYASDDDLEYEASHAEENFEHSKSYLEFIALYRKFCEMSPHFGVALFHGSVLEMDGKAYMFTAPSGTGKSTHAKLWREVYGDKVTMINDDKPLLKWNPDLGKIMACGTPWDGKHHLSNNTIAPLFGMCFLRQDDHNEICAMSKEKLVSALMSQIYRPMNVETLEKTMDIVDKIIECVPVYDMECTISKEAAVMSHDRMVLEKD